MRVEQGIASGMRAGLAVIAAMLLFNTAQAAPPAAAKAEIDYLVLTVANSDCEFFRNGTWYDSKMAAAHLTAKLDYLVARNLVQSAEDFIDKAVTQSSMSGQAYVIRCKGGAAVPSNQWLRILLARHRESLDTPGTLEAPCTLETPGTLEAPGKPGG